MPGWDELPSTLRRSSAKARRTWAKAHDAAVRTYGEGERAHRTAYSALKHGFEKVGDRWRPKSRRGPSDEQARRGAGMPPAGTAGGVDASASRAHLTKLAAELGIRGRTRMTKRKLVDALRRANDRLTARARER